MRQKYRVGRAPQPVPSLRGARQRPRPIITVGIGGPAHFHQRDCLLDTGADDTIFPEVVANVVGVDLSSAPTLQIHLAGRAPIVCRYAAIELRITDGTETYEWSAIAGFVPILLQFPLLGYAGFYEYFDVTFHGGDRELVIVPGRLFAGRRS